MAKGRAGRGPSRMDKRREAEAAEAREKDDEREDETEEEAEDEGDDEGDDEEGGKKKKKPAKKKAVKKPAAKKPATKRTRTAKEVRRKAVWVVFDNSNKPVGTFPFNQREEAEAAMAKKIEEKKGTFFLNLIKEEIKDKE
jgi:hypothetical protein